VTMDLALYLEASYDQRQVPRGRSSRNAAQVNT